MPINYEGRAVARRAKRLSNVIIIFCCLQICFPGFAQSAAPIDDEVRIDALTNDILHKEIDLERYYLQYRIQGTKTPKFRRARYFGLQVASAASSLAGNIEGTALSAGHIKNPDAISLRSSRQSLELGLVGIVLDGGSSIIELCSNSLIALKNIKNQTSPGAAVKNVVARIKAIDSLIVERETIVKRHPELNTTRIYSCEGRVLKSFRDWCLSEFADVYADVKSSQASSNIYYALDIAADSVYLAAQILAIKALTRPGLAYASASTGVVGDSLGISSAPASVKSYKVMYKFWRQRLAKKLKEDLKKSEKETKAAMTELDQELASRDIAVLEATGSLPNRISVYLLWSSRYDEVIQEGLVDERHQNKVALQGELSGPAISSAYMAQDVLALAALHKYPHRPKAQNNLYMAGYIAATAGTASSLALTNYWLFDQIRYQRRMRKKGMLPEQLLAARLKTLDELDAKVPVKGAL